MRDTERSPPPALAMERNQFNNQLTLLSTGRNSDSLGPECWIFQAAQSAAGKKTEMLRRREAPPAKKSKNDEAARSAAGEKNHKKCKIRSTFAGKPIIRLEQIIILFHLFVCSTFEILAMIIVLELII